MSSAVESPDWDAASGGGEVIFGRFRCERRSRSCGWLVSDGQGGSTFVPARCGAPNKCAYCAYQTVIENMVVVGLDAERFGHPRHGLTLTTRDPVTSPAAFRRDVEKTMKALRRLDPWLQYLGMVEFTSGRGARSGGHRRIHQHLLLKNVNAPADDLEAVVQRVWEQRTGASRVELRELRSAGGATAYLLAHHHKRDQAPPPGWSGKRLRSSRSYYGEPVAELRKQAGEMLRSKRLRRVARRMVDWESLDGAPDEVLDREWSGALSQARHEASMVTFVKLNPDGAIIGSRRVGAA